jgi:hypothetical protein
MDPAMESGIHGSCHEQRFQPVTLSMHTFIHTCPDAMEVISVVFQLLVCNWMCDYHDAAAKTRQPARLCHSLVWAKPQALSVSIFGLCGFQKLHFGFFEL